jgi:hypothetical protein
MRSSTRPCGPWRCLWAACVTQSRGGKRWNVLEPNRLNRDSFEHTAYIGIPSWRWNQGFLAWHHHWSFRARTGAWLKKYRSRPRLWVITHAKCSHPLFTSKNSKCLNVLLRDFPGLWANEAKQLDSTTSFHANAGRVPVLLWCLFNEPTPHPFQYTPSIKEMRTFLHLPAFAMTGI